MHTGSIPRPLLLAVACAMIDDDGRVLVTRRPEGKPMAGFWEFPGGKIEPGESPEQALIRELTEELGVTVGERCLAPLTFVSHAYENYHVLMPLFVTRRWTGELEAREGQELAWTTAARLREFRLLPSNEPLIAIIRDWL
jgi:8-oxo-dGTP diphosphatase